MRVGVERRRVAVGVGEGFGQRALGLTRRLVEHLSDGLAVEVTELAGGQRLLQVEHLEQVELQIAHVALVVAHALRLSLRTHRGTVADRRTRLGGPRLVLREAGAGSEVSGDTWNTVHRRYRTAGHHRRRTVIAVLVQRLGAGGRSGENRGTAHKPTSSDLHRCECSAMADPLSSVLPSAYGPKVPLSWDLAIMLKYHNLPGGPNRWTADQRVHLPFTRPRCDGEYIYCALVLPVL